MKETDVGFPYNDTLIHVNVSKWSIYNLQTSIPLHISCPLSLQIRSIHSFSFNVTGCWGWKLFDLR